MGRGQPYLKGRIILDIAKFILQNVCEIIQTRHVGEGYVHAASACPDSYLPKST